MKTDRFDVFLFVLTILFAIEGTVFSACMLMMGHYIIAIVLGIEAIMNDIFAGYTVAKHFDIK